MVSSISNARDHSLCVSWPCEWIRLTARELSALHDPVADMMYALVCNAQGASTKELTYRHCDDQRAETALRAMQKTRTLFSHYIPNIGMLYFTEEPSFQDIALHESIRSETSQRIVSFAEGAGFVAPSYQVAKAIGMDRQTVRSHIYRLRDAGILVKENGRWILSQERYRMYAALIDQRDLRMVPPTGPVTAEPQEREISEGLRLGLMYQFVEESPGITPGQIAQQGNLNYVTVVNTLEKLESYGLVKAKPFAQKMKLHFTNEWNDEEMRVWIDVQREVDRLILGAINRKPAKDSREVAERTNQKHHSVQRRIRELSDKGYIDQTESGLVANPAQYAKHVHVLRKSHIGLRQYEWPYRDVMTKFQEHMKKLPRKKQKEEI